MLSASGLHLVSLLAESVHAATVLVPLLVVVRVPLFVPHSSFAIASFLPFRLRLGSFGADEVLLVRLLSQPCVLVELLGHQGFATMNGIYFP